MDKKICKLTKKERQEMFDLSIYAFNKQPSVDRREHFSRLAEHSWNYGVKIDQKLVSQVMCTPFEVNFHGTFYQMGGIGYVASYPEYRGQGGIKEIMEMVLKDMKDARFALSYLAPFSYSFYRQFGYEQVFENLTYTLKANELPRVKRLFKGQVVRMAEKEVIPLLDQVYRQDEKHQRGGVVRNEWWWHFLTFKHKETYNYSLYYDEKKQVKGYLIYERLHQEFHIVEWSYTTKEAFYALAHFIVSHQSAFQTFTYTSPNTEGSLSYLLPNPLGNVSVLPYMMARIVDIPSFLQTYPFKEVSETQHFFIEVNDSFAPWNTGLFSIVISPSKEIQITKVEETTENKDQKIIADIQSFTQLFMGYRLGEQLSFYGKITGNKACLERLAALLPKHCPALQDYF